MLGFSGFILILICHVLCFIDEVKERTRSFVLAGYYVFVMVWFLLIVFFYVFNALKSD